MFGLVCAIINMYAKNTEALSFLMRDSKMTSPKATQAHADNEPILILIAKSAMLILFAWSGFFWSGVSIYNFYKLDPEYSYIATRFLIGSVLLLVSLNLCFFRKYILQFAFTFAGAIPFLMAATEMIEVAVKTEVEYTPSFELRYLPIIAFVIISFCLAMVKTWQNIAKRTEERNKFDNSPTKSILD